MRAIELIAQDSESGIIYDLSELSPSINWKTELTEQPGKLEFTFIKNPDIHLNHGSIISMKVDGKGTFFGWVFGKGINQDDEIKLTAYDQTRYLKNKDTFVLAGLTAHAIFAKLCNDAKLKFRLAALNSYIVLPKVHDNKSIYEVLSHGIDETLIHTGNWYHIYDDFGTLVFDNLNNLKTNLYIGDESLLTGFSYDTSIDSDTYNQIKLVKENKETSKRDVYIVKDSSNIKKWGTLQYFEEVDENDNPAQIIDRADKLLKLKNRVTKTLSLPCLGDMRVRAGSGIAVQISSLEGEGLSGVNYFLVKSCQHSFENGIHLMNLELQVSI